MKTLLLCVVLVHSVVLTFAQVVVTTLERNMSLGVQPAMTVSLNELSERDAMKAFESYWKKNGARTEVKKGEMVAPDFVPKALKPTSFTLYATVEKEKSDAVVYLWVFDGSQFITKSHQAYPYFERELKTFAVAEIRKPYEKQLVEKERALAKRLNEQKALEKERNNLKKNIDDCTRTIAAAESKLKTTESDLSKNNINIKELQSETEKLKKQIDGIQ